MDTQRLSAIDEIEMVTVLVRRPWTSDALCIGKTRLFFAPRAERPQARERREARAFQLCSKCPVAKECRESARENHEYGYWGGENEEDRYLAGYTVAAPIGIRTRLPRIA